jgi:hypothetical protein
LETEDGAERRITEIVIDNMMLLSNRGAYVADNAETEKNTR